jgi:hypothetical protein
MTGRKILINTIVIASFAFGATWLGCKSDDASTNPGGTTISAPANPRAYSASANSVGLQWTLSTTESDASFSGYVVRAKTSTGTIAATANVAKGIAATVVAGLTEGVVYTFVIRSTATGSVESTDSASVVWSPARRYENESGQPAPIKVYETSSSGLFASGLIFSRVSAGGPQTVSILGVDSSLIDVYVKTETNNAVSLNSSNVFRAGRRITRFSTTVRDDSTLNNPQAIPPDTTTFNNASVLIDSVQVSSSKLYYFKGNDGNYGRVLIERNGATGRLIWGTSPEQYLSLRISYQSVPFNPYSKPTKIGNNQTRSQQ